jgi:hypothetical protein
MKLPNVGTRLVLFYPCGTYLLISGLPGPAEPPPEDRLSLSMRVPDPCYSFDHLRHPRKCPHRGGKPVRLRPGQKCRLRLRQLLARQFVLPPVPPRPRQCIAALLLLGAMPP